MNHIYVPRDLGRTSSSDVVVLGYAMTATAAVRVAERIAREDGVRTEVLRYRAIEDQVEHLNGDLADRVWDSETGWTGV